MDKPIILGVDPGTTVGVCCLDLDGRVVESWSKKEYPLHELIAHVLARGRVIAVGTDKGKTPGFVRDVATKLGARLIHPPEDLPAADKHVHGKNAHESDATAAALFAHRQLAPLIRRVREAVKMIDGVTEERLLLFLIQDPRISIHRALEILQSPVEKDIAEGQHIIAQKQFTPENFQRLLLRLRHSLRDEHLLRKRIASLEAAALPQPIAPPPKPDAQIRFKEDRIKSLSSQLERERLARQRLGEEIVRLNYLLARAGIIGKKLENLGMKEVEAKKRLLNIVAGDILVVTSCAEFSREIIENLAGSIILTDGKVPREIIPRLRVVSRRSIIAQSQHFCLIDHRILQEELKKLSLLSDIVKEYRDQRQK